MRIILCVTNDLSTDRRVDRIALSLMKLFTEVRVIGRIRSQSMDLADLPYQTFRMHLLFNKGFLFYAEYNIRLFLRLLFTRADALVANDLDTLPAVFMASRIKGLPVAYDSHEYFTEVPELIGRKRVKRIWEKIESQLVPRLKYAYTVSASLANEYNYKYGINMRVIRNLPFRTGSFHPAFKLRKSAERIILYQGSLNMGRGLEAMIRAMQYIDETRLYILGTGDIETELKHLVTSLALNEKVCFTGRIPARELLNYTVQADLGVSLEEKMGLNYYYALPNKLFDYIQARIPVLVSDLPEMKSIVNHYGIGKIATSHDPYKLSLLIGEMLMDRSQQNGWKNNLEVAAEELCWEKEEQVLLELFQELKKEIGPAITS